VVSLSSGAGIIGVPGMPLYSASKFALEGLTEALAGEVAAFGVRVTLVEPGAVNTGFARGSLRETHTRLPAYAAITGEGAAGVRKYYGDQASEAAPVARRILAAVDSAAPPLRLVIGPDAAWGVRAKLDSVAADLAASDTASPAR
jgi:NAD(P)-dependent dehydrogenase (short-subunit alcohol dehydrogenase family)